MVKKKVVKKNSSKATPKGKKANTSKQHNILIKSVPEKPAKSKVRRHAIIKSLAVAKALHNKSKVENLELAANIAVKDASISEPVIETKNVEPTQTKPVEVPEKTVPVKVVEQPKDDVPDSAIVQPDPVYAEDVKPDFPVNKSEGITKGMRITVLVVTTIILLFWLLTISMSIVTNVDKVVERNTTVTITEPIKINFERYSTANAPLSVTDNSLIGYLREEIVSSNRSAANQTPFYILDDYNNKVELILDFEERRRYDLLFKSGVTSEKTYNVTGTFKYNQYDEVKYKFSVDNITPQDRPTHTIETTKVENVTIEGKGFRIDLSTGWKKIIGKK